MKNYLGQSCTGKIRKKTFEMIRSYLVFYLLIIPTCRMAAQPFPCPPSSANTCSMINNGDFSSVTTLTPGSSPFENNYVCFWRRVQSSPQVFQSTDPLYAPWYASMWAQGPSSYEAIAQVLTTGNTIVSGQNYVITFEVRNAVSTNQNTLDHYRVRLNSHTPGSPWIYQTGTPIAGTVQEIVHGTSLPYSATWAQVSQCFTADGNYNQIYFYPQQNLVGSPQAWFMIDNVRLQRVEAANAGPLQIISCGQPPVTIGTVPTTCGPYTFTWTSSSPGGPYPNTATINVSPPYNTTYTLTMTGPGGCVTTSTVEVRVQCGWAVQGGGTGRGNSVASRPGYKQTYVTGQSGSNFFLTKYDECGNIVGTVTSSGDTAEGMGICVDANGNSYITGKFSGTVTFGAFSLNSSGLEDVFVTKYDNFGNCVWAYKAGGGLDDCGKGVVLKNNWLYVTGFISGNNISFNDISAPATASGNITNITQEKNFFIARYDISNQECDWAKNFIHSQGGKSWANDIALDASGNIHITGANTWDIAIPTIASDSDPTAFVAKFDGNGNPLWGKSYPIPYNSTASSEGKGLIIDSNNDVFFTGYFQGSIDFDPASSAIPVFSNIAGKAVFYTRLNSSGTAQWSMAGACGSDDAEGNSVCVTDNGKLLVTGYFKNTLDFYAPSSWGPMSGALNASSDVFVAQFNASNGLASEVAAYAGTSNESGNDICSDDFGNAHVTGSFRGTMNFNFYNSQLTTGLTTAAAEAMFLRKHCGVSGILAKPAGGNVTGLNPIVAESAMINIFPNPNKGFLTLEWIIEKENEMTIEITDLYGKKVFESVIEKSLSGKQELDLSVLANGIYILKVSNSEFSKNLKIMKE